MALMSLWAAAGSCCQQAEKKLTSPLLAKLIETIVEQFSGQMAIHFLQELEETKIRTKREQNIRLSIDQEM